MILTLRDFQKDGVVHLFNKRRTILADEMGLGKTVQTLFATQMFLNRDPMDINKKLPWLIIAPTTLGAVWKNEIKKWYGKDKKSITVKGNRAEKMAILSGFDPKTSMAHNADFVICTYESLHALLPIITTQKWAGFVCDEAHKLKNRDAKMHKACSEIQKKFPKVPLFLLTGTPIMNRAEELWALLHMLDPEQYSNFHTWANHHLKDRSWSDEYADKNEDSNRGSWAKQFLVPKNREAFRDYFSTYCLRRLKKDNIDLPEKTKVIHSIELDLDGGDPTADEGTAAYEKYKKSQRGIYDTMRDSYFMEWEAEEGEGREVTAAAVIAAIIRMKQIAISPDLIIDSGKADQYSLPLRGAKIDALEELLDECVEAGQKVVVFSQFEQCVTRLHNMYKSKYNCEIMTGKQSQLQRENAVDRFQNNEDSQVFFIGTQVGGVGITLTSATVCIFMDLMWNPALNDQAADRLHRMGQRSPVTIYELEAEDTIEQHIRGILEEKQQLINDVMPNTEYDEDRRPMQNWRMLLGK